MHGMMRARSIRARTERTIVWLACLVAAVLHAGAGLAVPARSAGAAELAAQSAEFRRDIIQVAANVYVAVGYSASNVVLVQGSDGVIIVDTGTDPVDAAAIRTAFGGRLSGPVRAIIYTHSHPDHTGGARIFAAGDRPQIWAHQPSALPDIGRANRDGGDQFGMALPDGLFINAGVQRQFGRETPPTRAGYLPPTHGFSGERQRLDIAGVTMELIHTPGESTDMLTVWLPAIRVAITGDNVVKSFPNVAPIRGARFRSPEAWIASIDTVLALQPAAVVPGHTRPLLTADAVAQTLTAYRDGIRSVLDQTVAGLAQGARPDELAATVKLPPGLAAHPWLREYYGSVEWMVRGLYADRIGWFDGNATGLLPLPGKARAERLVAALGGARKVRAAAQAALASGDPRWAAELADAVMMTAADDRAALRIKADSLAALAEQQINAIARNYYLTVAQRLREQAGTP